MPQIQKLHAQQQRDRELWWLGRELGEEDAYPGWRMPPLRQSDESRARRVVSCIQDATLDGLLAFLNAHNVSRRAGPEFLVSPYILQALRAVHARDEVRSMMPAMDAPSHEIRKSLESLAVACDELAKSARGLIEPHVWLGPSAERELLVLPTIDTGERETVRPLSAVLTLAAGEYRRMASTLGPTTNRRPSSKKKDGLESDLRSHMAERLTARFRDTFQVPRSADVARVIGLLLNEEIKPDLVAKVDRRRRAKGGTE